MSSRPNASDTSVRNEENPPGRRQNGRQTRKLIPEACQACRTSKTKCNEVRPCETCVKRGIPCEYQTLNGESRMQAYKRKHSEIHEANQTYERIFELFRTRSDQDVKEMVRHIRNDQDPKAVLAHMEARNALASNLNISQNLSLAVILVNLLHSTGSLQEIITLAMDSITRSQLPRPQALQHLRNRIVHISLLEVILSRLPRQIHPGSSPLSIGSANRSAASTASSTLGVQGGAAICAATSDDSPPHCVRVGTWTTITSSDQAVSHLVSLFLAWINPTWRFVEEDLFLKGMRSEDLNSEFCSPLLVNSICAIASLHSEDEVAFAGRDRERITRGQHFHDEAIRLWILEENQPSITNMQALCVLGLDSNYRARDKLGLTLVPIAAQLDRKVPVHSDSNRCASLGITENEYLRGRLSVHWMVECTHIIMRVAFMNSAEAKPRRSDLPDISSVFRDRPEAWTGYPLTRESVPYKPTLYLRERCKLAELFGEIHALILSKSRPANETLQDFASAARGLSTRMKDWYELLPHELHYRWPMSVAVWELHASYLAFLMILWITVRTRFQEGEFAFGYNPESKTRSNEDQEDMDAEMRSELAQESLSSAIPLAHQAARMLRDFRERYGLKITPAWLLQLQAVAASVLLLDTKLKDADRLFSEGTTQSHDIQDSCSAFDEVFRCLLGTGVEVMIARGIARMTYHTAMKQRIALSQSTWSLLQLMSDTAWRPSDLSLLSSTFPNFATIKAHEDQERMSALLSKWESINID